ncbi:MAG: DUF167 domain-containing protein [Candidatus Omnitrophota bacterium]
MNLQIRVHPGTSREKLIRDSDGSFIAYLTKPAVEGQANKALIRLLSKELDIPKSKISIIRGEKAKTKIVSIA